MSLLKKQTWFSPFSKGQIPSRIGNYKQSTLWHNPASYEAHYHHHHTTRTEHLPPVIDPLPAALNPNTPIPRIKPLSPHHGLGAWCIWCMADVCVVVMWCGVCDGVCGGGVVVACVWLRGDDYRRGARRPAAVARTRAPAPRWLGDGTGARARQAASPADSAPCVRGRPAHLR